MNKINIEVKYIAKTVLIKNLKPHPVFRQVFHDEFRNSFYGTEAQYFNHYDKPLVYKNEILSLVQEINAARYNGLKTIEVYEVENIDEDDIIRLIVHRAFYYEKSWGVKYHLMKCLLDYLKSNAKGIALGKEVGGDTRYKLATITGISQTYVSYIFSVYSNNDTKLIRRLEKGEISLKAAYNKSNCNKDLIGVLQPDGMTAYSFAQTILDAKDGEEPSVIQQNKAIAPPRLLDEAKESEEKNENINEVESVKDIPELQSLKLNFKEGRHIYFEMENESLSSWVNDEVEHRFKYTAEEKGDTITCTFSLYPDSSIIITVKNLDGIINRQRKKIESGLQKY